MKAIVLAAGYGTRLGKVGELLPKGLIEYKKTNLIGHVVKELRNIGIWEIAVVTNEKYFNQYANWNQTLTEKVLLINDLTSAPENRLGALGDLRFGVEQLGWRDESIVVAPSDTYFEFSLKGFQATINKHPDEFATIAKKMSPELIKNRLACAVVTEENRISECVEKPEVPLWPFAVMPFYYYPTRVHELIGKYANEGNSMDAPGSIIPWLLKNRIPVNAYVVSEKTLDVGTPSDLEQLNEIG